MSTIKNKKDLLPKEKKEPPLGKWQSFKFTSLNNFGLKFERQLLTTVSNSKVYSQMFSHGQDDEHFAFAQRRLCVATGDDSSTKAWTIKIFLN